MSEPMIVASAKKQPTRVLLSAGNAAEGWPMLGWTGLAFLAVGGVDFAFAWIPPQFGAREWWFATVSQTFNGLPILILGIALVLMAAERLERRWWTWVGAGSAGLLFVWMIAVFIMWATTVPVALATVPEAIELGVRKAVMKTVLQAGAYSAVLVYMVRRVWLQSRPAHDEADMPVASDARAQGDLDP